MRTFITLTIVLLVFVAPVLAQSAADEAAIKKATEERITAWNAKDVKAYPAFFDKGCKRALDGSPCGQSIVNGEFINKNASSKILKQGDVQFITSDVAIYRYTTEVTGLVDADGKPQTARRNQAARVFVKKGGKWLVAVSMQQPIEQ